VDGVKSLTPVQRLSLIDKLKLSTKVAPTRRIWIPKPGKDEKRPLGIPTIQDRALHGLAKLALEPEWEARFEANAYGFRPGRSCHDAIGAIFNSMKFKPKYVLDADIAKCFDKIDHEQLLRKLNTYPTLRKQIRAWLKAGVMDRKKFFPTSEGTPQGGVISPLLANIALQGMENRIKEICKNAFLIRYADDFVVLHESLTVVQRCREILCEWLKDMKLELKPSKTRFGHTLIPFENSKPGFEFLGFNIQQFKTGKYLSGKLPNTNKKLGFTTIITPSKDSVKRHYRQLTEVIKTHRGKRQARLINSLNPIIRGWSNYFSTVVSQDVFEKLSKLVVQKLLKWGYGKHRNKGKKWIVTKYFHQVKGDNWVFATPKNNGELFQLLRHSEIPRKRHVKVRGEASPYDGNLVY
jgi:RNA-directed DNA polymerase